jgi:hypothetical protein
MFIAFYIDKKTTILPMYSAKSLDELLNLLKNEDFKNKKNWGKKKFHFEIHEIEDPKKNGDCDGLYLGKFKKKKGFVKNKLID